MGKYRWGILGAGSIAEEMAGALMNLQGGAYAIANRTPANARRLADQYHIQKVYATAEELLSDDAVDIVYIATPHNLHYQGVKQALLSGKHVLCEKAITVNSAELTELRALAKERGLIVEEAMTLYHMPVMAQVRRQVEEGAIGKVNLIQVNFGSCKPYDVTNRFFSPDLAGGALLDIGVYALSFVRYFAGEAPEDILTSARFFETGVDEQSGIILTHPSGITAVVSLSMRAKQPKVGVIAGDNGYIQIENYPRANQAILQTLTPAETRVITAGETAQALEYEVLDMESRLEGRGASFELPTLDVMDTMTRIRAQWGFRYPFE